AQERSHCGKRDQEERNHVFRVVVCVWSRVGEQRGPKHPEYEHYPASIRHVGDDFRRPAREENSGPDNCSRSHPNPRRTRRRKGAHLCCHERSEFAPTKRPLGDTFISTLFYQKVSSENNRKKRSEYHHLG